MSKDNKPSAKKKCAFLICPIGDEGSAIRERLEQMYTYVIEPVAKECNYEVQHAGQISKPGLVTTQIVSCIIKADLIIADLTGRNANVMYELALCHILKKPTVQLIEKGETLPFDISISRTIQIDHTNLKSVYNAMTELGKQIKAVEANPNDVDSPISVAIGVQTLSQSGDPQKEAIAELRELSLQVISQVGEIKNYLTQRENINTIQSRGIVLEPPKFTDSKEYEAQLLERIRKLASGRIDYEPEKKSKK